MAGSDSECSEAGSDDELDGSGSKRQPTSAPSPRQPKRGKGGRAVVVDDSDEPDSQAEDEGSPDAAAESGDDEEGGDLPLDLDAFRFNGKAPAAAAGCKWGAAKRRGSSGSGSMESSEEPDGATTAAALQEEEELSRHVLDASEFAPEELTKLPRVDDIDKCLAVRFGEDDSITVLVKLTGEQRGCAGLSHGVSVSSASQCQVDHGTQMVSSMHTSSRVWRSRTQLFMRAWCGCGVDCLCTAGKSYRNAVWLPSVVIERRRPSLLRNFLSRHAGGQTDTDWPDNNNINPVWYKVRGSRSGHGQHPDVCALC
jgi:hypothetical protein